MRLIKLLILTVVIIVFVVLGVANMTPVNLQMLPAFLGRGDLQIANIPLALVILVSFLAGLLIGVILELLRETKHRAEASRLRRENTKLRHEVAERARQAGEDEDLTVAAE